MKYKITKTDLQINNKLYSEGSEVELTKEQSKGIEDYLIPIETKSTKPARRSSNEGGDKGLRTTKQKRSLK